jgi:nucleoside-diphosphate-sugar epimerase
MTRIAILGASSQVGSSVALFLKKMPDIEVVGFIRSTYSSVFFELADIPFSYIDMTSPDDIREKLGAMDVVLDFGYPAGQLQDILVRSKDNIGKVLAAMKKGGAYFYMSSIMAYGMPDGETWIKHYRFPRTSYSYIKRKIERFTFTQGKHAGIRVYNFRLGQVHGFLQSVNGSFRKKIADTDTIVVDGSPNDPVNVIFIYSLCEAILQCVNGTRPPGLYTLVADPQWTLQELYEYYLEYYGLKADILYKPRGKAKAPGLQQRLINLARPYRAILEAYFLIRFPSLAVRIKGGYRRSELLDQQNAAVPDYIDFNLLGRPAFNVLSGPVASKSDMLRLEKEYEDYYNSLITQARK